MHINLHYIIFKENQLSLPFHFDKVGLTHILATSHFDEPEMGPQISESPNA